MRFQGKVLIAFLCVPFSGCFPPAPQKADISLTAAPSVAKSKRASVICLKKAHKIRPKRNLFLWLLFLSFGERSRVRMA